MKIASGWRRMSATPPRFASSFSSSASIEMRSFAGSRSSCDSVFSERSSCRRWIRSEIVRQFVSRPPSQRWLTYGMPTRRASSRTASCACFFVPTNRTEPPRSAIARAKSCASSSRLLRLLQVDDVDAAALGEDEALHLRVPAARLVAEVDAGLQQFLHGNDGHESPFLGFDCDAPAGLTWKPASNARPPSTRGRPTGSKGRGTAEW